jgi:hypothetical protein
MADRVAAQSYGKIAFQNGLTYVIKRNLEFMNFANHEIEEAQKQNRSFNNLYELSGTTDNNFEEELNKQLNRKTNNDDTHPSPADRFKLIEGLSSGRIAHDDIYVKDLFSNWDSLTSEMTKLIEDAVKKR